MESSAKDVLSRYPEYEATIGIEVHVQLKTQSKIFCSCPNQFGDKPNKNICHICAGYPGVLPVLNKKVVDGAIKAGLATNCEISKVSEFARKHYRYPDLPKNFQTTQGDKPICSEGYIPIELGNNRQKKIRIERIHMEEDAGKAAHEPSGISLVDLNRTGTPLLEIVTYPDIDNAYEAKAYLQRLRSIIQYLGVSDANMEEGSFRADINVSVKKKTAEELGTRVELKNINSFKFIGQAINYEIVRQIELVESGDRVRMETRLWNEREQKTTFMRSKEYAQDYRYFAEPDLPLIVIDSAWIDRMKKAIPELPHNKQVRFVEEYALTPNEAEVLVAKAEIATFFENTVAICNKPKQVSNWMLRDLLGYLNENKMTLSECRVTPETLAELVSAIDQGVINTKVAQDVFLEMAQSGKYPSVIIQEKDLKQIGSSDELEAIAKQIIDDNPDVVANYKGGNTRVFTFFIGQAMKATKGKGNPRMLQEIFKKLLG